MPPHEKRTVTVGLARATAEEADKAAATAGVKPAAADDDGAVRAARLPGVPAQYADAGEIRVRGRALRTSTGGVAAHGQAVGGRRLGPVAGAAGRPAPSFDATLPAPAGGWYKLEVRAIKDGKEVARRC